MKKLLLKAIGKYGSGKHQEKVLVNRGGKTFYQTRTVGAKDKEKTSGGGSLGSNIRYEKNTGFYQKKTDGGWVNLTKDKAKAQAYSAKNKEVTGSSIGAKKLKTFTKRPHIKTGARVRISSTASSIGKGIIGTIKEIGDDFVRIVDEAGKVFRVSQAQLAIAKSSNYDYEALMKAEDYRVLLEELIKAGAHKYKRKKKVNGKWVYDYGKGYGKGQSSFKTAREELEALREWKNRKILVIKKPEDTVKVEVKEVKKEIIKPVVEKKKLVIGKKLTTDEVEAKYELEKRQSRTGYINEKESAVKNIGEDVLGAGRHKFDTYSLEDMEKMGVAGKYFNKSHLYGSIDPDIEQRRKSGDSNSKIYMMYALQRSLKITVANDPDARRLYEEFHRIITHADATAKTGKDLLQSINDNWTVKYSVQNGAYVFGSNTRGDYIRLRKRKKDVIGNKTYKLLYESGKSLDDMDLKLVDNEEIFKELIDQYSPKEHKKAHVSKHDIVSISDEDMPRFLYYAQQNAKQSTPAMGWEAVRDASKPLYDKLLVNTEEYNAKAEAFSKKTGKRKWWFNDTEEGKKISTEREKIQLELKSIGKEKITEKDLKLVVHGMMKRGTRANISINSDKIKNFNTPLQIDLPVEKVTLVEEKEGAKLIDPPELKVGTEDYVRKGGRVVPKGIKAMQKELSGSTVKTEDALGNTVYKQSGELSNTTMNFKSLQYGNSVTDSEREHHTKGALGAFKDLSEITGIPENEVSFSGRLGLGFGARGKGNALAHYEPDTFMINMTRKRGFGSLGHEWFHALDNVISNVSTNKPYKGLGYGGMATEGQLDPDSSTATIIGGKIKKVTEIIVPEMQKKLKGYQGYWREPKEIMARSFEAYLNDRLKKKGRSSTYLAKEDYGHIVYPQGKTKEKLFDAFDDLFAEINKTDVMQKALKNIDSKKKKALKYYISSRKG